MPNHRLAAHQRNLQWLMLVDQPEDLRDEFIAAIVADATQVRAAFPQMGIAVCVASGTFQRTLSSDFNRQHRNSTGEDFSPRLENVQRLHERPIAV